MTNSTADSGDRPRRPWEYPWQYLVSRAREHLDDSVDRLPVTHIHDLPWHFLPPPRRWHRCWPQSRGSCGPFRLVERCPCGGTRLDGHGRWMYRNRRASENFGRGPGHGGENVGNTDPLLIDMSHPLTATEETDG